MENRGGQQQFTYAGERQQGLGASSPTLQQPEAVESEQIVQWQASEFIDHQKSTSWFVFLVIGTLLISVPLFILTRDILATLVVAMGAIAFGMYARQKPRTLHYSLLPSSIKVGLKEYRYDDFRSFSVTHEGALYSIILEPIKRFMPPLTIYFAGEDGERIFDTLAGHLPHEARKADFVENIMKKIRF